jgi:predicted glutamine amidotransferase
MLAMPGASSPQAQELLAAFRSQARDSRAGAPEGEAHPDGWGLVEASETAIRYLGRRAKDASSDPEFERAVLRSRGANGFLVAHLRQASKGRVAVPNTHPFIADGFAFCPNGTIEGDLEIIGDHYEGDTDSERYFHRLLRAIQREASVPNAFEATVQEIEATSRFSSLTCLLTDGRTLWGYRRVGDGALEDCGTRECALESYGLGVGRVAGVRFVAQEPTHLGAIEEWTEVPDGHLLVWPRDEAPQIRPLRLTSLA